jgi:hypothetical protein
VPGRQRLTGRQAEKTDRQAERQTDTDRLTEADRETDRKTDTDRQTETDRQTQTDRDRQTQTDRQMDRWTDGQPPSLLTPSHSLSPTSSLPHSLFPQTSYFMYRFHVRILIPCYKEDLAVVASTVQAALSADLPALTRRTVYLLDDGKVR